MWVEKKKKKEEESGGKIWENREGKERKKLKNLGMWGNGIFVDKRSGILLFWEEDERIYLVAENER